MEDHHHVRRTAGRRFNIDKAHLLLEDIPTDLQSDLTDEEPDSDPDDEDLELPPNIHHNQDHLDFHESVDDSGDEGPSTSSKIVSRRRGVDKIWKSAPKEPMEHNCTAFEGPKLEEFPKFEKPIDIFMTFMNSAVDDILGQTNLYKNQQQRNNVAVIQRTELLGFLGINMLMGYHVLPSWTHYWSQDADLRVPFVSEAMTRNRFGQILSCLHINNNLAVPDNNEDKLYKLRPLIKALNEQYVKLYDVSRVLSVDESMILFKGRSSIKQYNPMKPIKRGYKLWMRADMDGYVSKFDVYQGKNGMNDRGEFGLGESVVISMCEDLYGKWHEVYFDNYFTSVTLMDHLFDNGVKACGTIRANRKGLPGFVIDKILKRGDSDMRVSTDGKSLAIKWMDNKAVTIMSNFHGTNVGAVKRTQKDGTQLEIPCPQAIADYNKHMGGVDKADMLCALYGLGRKSKKWWHRIFFGLIDRTVVNACVVFKKLHGREISLLNFRRQLSQSLIVMAYPIKIGRPLATPTASPVPTKKRKTAQ